MRKSFLLALVALPGAGPALAAQEFEGVFTVRIKDMPGGTALKTYMKGGKYRMEVSMEGQQMAFIADPAAGETYMVVPQQQMVMVIKMSEAEKLAAERTGAAGAGKIEALGKKEEIAGHACEYFRVTHSGGHTDACLATGLGTFRGGSGLFGPPTPRGGSAAPSWAREVLNKGAFPLKVVDQNGGVLWEVTGIEKKTLEAELFVPPANFQRMPMPSFGRPPQN